jgi:putative glutamine amidotransferase
MTAVPRIAVIVTATAGQPDADAIGRRIELYGDAIHRHGGEALMLDATSPTRQRQAAFETMDGLLLSGGSDIDPARYGQPIRGSVNIQPEREAVELEAWTAAAGRDLPVLGICRGIQVINVFMGGRLIQDVGGHRMGEGTGPPVHHPLHVAPGTRLARMLFPRNVGGGVVAVNSFHHQAIGVGDLAGGLVACGWAASPAGDLVEGIESPGGSRFLLGLQCHPERTASTPPAFERVWRVFVDACRGPATARRAGRSSTSPSTTAGRPG